MRWLIVYLVFGTLFGLALASERKDHNWLGNAVAGAILGVPTATSDLCRMIAHDVAAKLDANNASEPSK